jgi:putative transposase
LLSLIQEAVEAGARQSKACEVLGLTERTLQRWRRAPGGEDARRGPKTPVAHRLTEAEKDEALAIANRPEYRNLTPEAVVAKAADEGIYVCSERSLRRVQKERSQDAYRNRAKPATRVHKPREYAASEPLRVLSWDITYLNKAFVRGEFFFLYLYVDVWSRKILGWEVHEEQTSERAADLLRSIAAEHDLEAEATVLHQDNGAPMKGATFLATLDDLGITKSFSRPRVSDDNAFIESLFRHLKYAPSFPRRGFESLERARAWVADFVHWYNHQHLHSAIGYVTPDDRHHGRDIAILDARRHVYDQAQKRNPARWTGAPRRWGRPEIVTLNPERVVRTAPKEKAQAA